MPLPYPTSSRHSTNSGLDISSHFIFFHFQGNFRKHCSNSNAIPPGLISNFDKTAVDGSNTYQACFYVYSYRNFNVHSVAITYRDLNGGANKYTHNNTCAQSDSRDTAHTNDRLSRRLPNDSFI